MCLAPKVYNCATHDLYVRGRDYNLLKWSKNANIKASNKELDFETVSQGNRHRSSHTQNVIPSIAAGHQFLQFGHIGPKSGIFPITVIVTHPGFCLRTTRFSANVVFTRLPLQEFAVSLWHLLPAKFFFIFQKTCCWKLFKPITFTYYISNLLVDLYKAQLTQF